MFPEYLNYNPCTVTINGYQVTNIQTKGLPPYKCEAHLESLSIKSSVVGSNNPNDYAASGTVTVVDHKNAVFDVLRGRLVEYLQNKKDNNYLSTIEIEIMCFTGKRTWRGWIMDWSYEFVGTTPSINLNWTSLPPNGNTQVNPPGPAEYYTPKDLISKLKESYKPAGCSDFPIVDAEGNDISDKLAFIGDKVNFDLSGLSSSSSSLADGYNFVIKNSTLDGKALAPGETIYDKENNPKFVVRFAETENNTTKTEEGEVTNKIVFVQNGSMPYYRVREKDNKWIIPMSSFNFNTQMSNMILQSRILNNPNGNTVQNMDHGQNYMAQPDSSPSTDQTSTAATGASGVVVSFECYNVLSFSMNNISEPVQYEVYDELGNPHSTSGQGTVTEVTYSLQGGVVKANVTCAEFYNSAQTESQSTGTPGSGGSGSGGSSGGSKDITSVIKSSNEEAVLRSDDTIVIPLSVDNTAQAVSNGEYLTAVTEFFDRGYAELKKEDRFLDYDYIENLVYSGNIGLFTLLIGVSNYGIKNVPAAWKDPVKELSTYSSLTPFGASDGGKHPYDHESGGLGIAHWDSDNLGTIYKTIGFAPEDVSDKLGSLLTVVTNPPTVANADEVKKGKPAKYYTGKVIGWDDIKYYGADRKVPVMSEGKCFWTRFDKGLKQDSEWLSWADHLLKFKNDKGMIFQSYLFGLWNTKFWEPTMKALRNATPSPGHNICLQDAIRIARMGNSAAGLINKAAGKSVSEQFDIYLSGADAGHVVRQWAFLRRATYILEQLRKSG